MCCIVCAVSYMYLDINLRYLNHDNLHVLHIYICNTQLPVVTKHNKLYIKIMRKLTSTNTSRYNPLYFFVAYRPLRDFFLLIRRRYVIIVSKLKGS